MTEEKGKPKKSRLKKWIFRLVILFAVVSVALALTIPPFMKMFAKTRCSEAKTNLGQIFNLQRSYYGDTGEYAGGENCFELIGWEPEEGYVQKYTYICGTDVIPAKDNSDDSCTMAYGAESSATGFTVVAIGNIDDDPTCDIWTVNTVKIMLPRVDDVLE